MNRQEAQVMAALLRRRGYAFTDDPAAADLVVLETCAVRAGAEAKVYGLLGRLREAARRGAAVAVCGCVAEGEAEAIVRRFPFVRIVLGPRQVARIGEAVDALASGDDRFVAVGGATEDGAVPDEEIIAPHVPGVSAWVTVMQGCSNACTFCVVPSRRGPAVSRPLEDVVREVERLATAGYREAALIGQNISFYGLDAIPGAVANPPARRRPGDAPRLIDLLEAVDGILPRIRFATSHPLYMGDEFFERFGGLRTVCPNLHLPVQSGSDRILRRMARLHTREGYLDLARRWRAAAPDGHLTTDIIVGFPGETEADVEATIDLVREARFEQVYAFAYSRRPATPAAALRGEEIPPEEIDRRLAAVQAAAAEAALRANRARVGRVEEVLVEGPAPRGPAGGAIAGRTRAGRVVLLPAGSAQPGDMVHVRIEAAGAWSMRGTPVRAETPCAA
jgi:tRNA-2-methylthio-N6-dimethylallyladenosine synthase